VPSRLFNPEIQVPDTPLLRSFPVRVIGMKSLDFRRAGSTEWRKLSTLAVDKMR
jgi:hypothetical protein